MSENAGRGQKMPFLDGYQVVFDLREHLQYMSAILFFRSPREVLS
jgi:hypothetical protein